MKITWRYTSLTIAFMIGLSGGGWHWRTASPVASLAVWPVMVAPLAATADATLTSVARTIEAVLSATQTLTPSATPTPSATSTRLPPTPNLAATQTRQAADIATAVAKTLAAQTVTAKTAEAKATKPPRATPTPSPLPSPLPSTPPSPLPSTPTPTRPPMTVALELIVIPGGEFVMGSSAADSELTLQECNQTEGNCQVDWFDGETPVRTVAVPAFSISKYEVTNEQYNSCVANGVCPPIGRIPVEQGIAFSAAFLADQAPVVAVSWDNANRFCRWVGARLPTEEEWEKAARGTDGGRRYPWGQTFEPGRANLSSGAPTAVGSYPSGASPYGVMDMAGNVFEWTATATGDGRYIIRGGAWSKFYFRGRVADRGTKLAPNFVNYDIGFGCVQ